MPSNLNTATTHFPELLRIDNNCAEICAWPLLPPHNGVKSTTSSDLCYSYPEYYNGDCNVRVRPVAMRHTIESRCLLGASSIGTMCVNKVVAGGEL